MEDDLASNSGVDSFIENTWAPLAFAALPKAMALTKEIDGGDEIGIVGVGEDFSRGSGIGSRAGVGSGVDRVLPFVLVVRNCMLLDSQSIDGL